MKEIPSWFTAAWWNCGFRVDFAGLVTQPAGWSRRRPAREQWIYFGCLDGAITVAQGAWHATLAAAEQVIISPVRPFTLSVDTKAARFLQMDFWVLPVGSGFNPLPLLGLPVKLPVLEPAEWRKQAEIVNAHCSSLEHSATDVLLSRPAAEGIIGNYLAAGFRADAFSQRFVPAWLLQIREYIQGHFDDAELTVAALAKKAGFSESHFSHAFREAFGQPPMKYLQELRLTLAARRLAAAHSEPIAEFYHGFGFKTQSYFTRAFRKHFGVPPAKWRSRPRALVRG